MQKSGRKKKTVVVAMLLLLVTSTWSVWAANLEPVAVRVFPDSTGTDYLKLDQLTDVDGTLFFMAYDASSGLGLWKSDGTTEGTVLVKGMWPTSGSLSPKDLINVNGTLFFTAGEDSLTGRELWKSDGTAAGTVMVKDIYPLDYYGSSRPRELTNVNGTLFFAAYSPSDGLWKSDGTSDGTVLVKDGPVGGLTEVNGTLFFGAPYEGGTDYELWKSDGTAAGTVLVKSIIPGPQSPEMNYLTNVNGTLFFTAYFPPISCPGCRGLWKSDGTAGGTVLIKEEPETSSFYDLINVNGTLFFTAYDVFNGDELWKSDGTTAGTVLVKEIEREEGPGGAGPSALTNVNGTLFFTVDHSQLWKSDGSSDGTILVKDIPQIYLTNEFIPLQDLTNVDGTLYFTSLRTEIGEVLGAKLWKSDGTSAGTVSIPGNISDGYVGRPLNLTDVNGTLFFNAFISINNEYNSYSALWKLSTGAPSSENNAVFLPVIFK